MKLAACPGLEQLRDFSSGRVAEEAGSTIAEHLDECPTCRVAVEQLSDPGDPLAASLRAEPEPLAFTKESDFRKALAFVEQIGREQSGAGVAPAREESPQPAKPQPPVPQALRQLREYEILEKLGEGGMGAVYKARHKRLKKIVALKVLPADRLGDHQAVSRFEREMEAVGQLDHPNIVRAMDAGDVDGTYYLVMEYVPGIDLSHLVRQVGPLPIAEACELIRQAAVGLQEAHEHGMVHRDIKPSNLMLTVGQARSQEPGARSQAPGQSGIKHNPTLKILDMGLALLSEAHSQDARNLTSTGQMMGTIDYMAPEQGGDSHQVDIRADIYSLGATLYKLLTGDTIYSGHKYQTPVKKMMALATQPAPPIVSKRPNVPPQLAALVHQFLAKDPAGRPATPQQVAEALAPFAAGADLAKLVARLKHAAPASDAPTLVPPGGSTSQLADAVTLDQVGQTAGLPNALTITKQHPKPRPASRRKLPAWPLIAAACGGAAVLVLLGILYFIETPEGTIQIEINDPSITAILQRDGKTTFQGVDKTHEIKLKPGLHGFTIVRGDLSFNTDKFELTKGETVRLSVKYLPGKVQVVRASDGKLLGERPVAGEIPAVTTAASTSAQDFRLAFDGVSSCVDIPTLHYKGSEPITIEGTIRADNPQRGAALISCSRIGLSIQPDSAVASTVWDPVERKMKISLKVFRPLASDRDVRLAISWDGKTYRLFVDGQLVAQQDAQPTFAPAAQAGFYLGAFGGIGKSFLFAGTMDEVRISKVGRYKTHYKPAARLEADADTLALYHFDEGTGNVLKDSSGNNYHGQIVGAKWVSAPTLPTLVASGSTDGLQFGPQDRVEIKSFRAAGADPLTVEAYVTPTAAKSTSLGCVLATDANILNLYLERDLRWVLYGSIDGQHTHLLNDSLRAIPGKRTHLAGVRTGKHLRLFVDGTLGVSRVESEATTIDSHMLQIGNLFEGVIDEVRVSRIARYEQDFVPESRFASDADTLALYHFDEGTGNVLKDSSGNNYHGQIVGAKWVTSDEPFARSVATPDLVQSSEYTGTYALEFKPQQAAFVGASAPGLTSHGPVTLELSVQPSVSSVNEGIAIASIGGVHLGRELGTGKWRLTTRDGNNETIFTKSVPLSSTRPNQVAIVAKSTQMQFYVDGKLIDTQSIAVPRPAHSPLTANFANVARDFTVRIGEIRISRGERYSTDYVVPTRFQVEPDTIALYRLTEGQGNRLADASGNGHYGTLNGPTWVRVGPPPALAPFDAAQAKAHQEAWAAHLGVPVEYTNSVGMKFRLIPPGEYTRGNPQSVVDEQLKVVEEQTRAQTATSPQHVQEATLKSNLDLTAAETPQHRVILTRPLYLGVCEVTQAEFETVMEQNPSLFASTGSRPDLVKLVAGMDTSRFPVEGVTYFAARDFCDRLNQREHLPANRGYALPTDAQWQFACRAGAASDLWFGEQSESGHGYEWTHSNAGRRTHAVGELQANAFGLFDMYGNVGEAVQDWWDPSYNKSFADRPAVDPEGPAPGRDNRVLRGGFTTRIPPFGATTRRLQTSRSGQQSDGLRVALSVDAVRQARKPSSGSSPAAAPEQVVDLLKLVDVNRDAVKGTWTLSANGLASDGTVPYCRLKLPYSPPVEYDFRIEFTAQAGNDILQLLTKDGKPFTWLMGAWGGRFDGFDTVTGHPLNREGTNIIGGPTSVRRGQRHVSVIQIRKDSITATIDGKEVVRHATNGSDLSMPEPWAIGERTIGLGTTFNPVVFHKVELVVPASPDAAAPLPVAVAPSSSFALQFNGQSSLVDVPSFRIPRDRPITYEAWIRVGRQEGGFPTGQLLVTPHGTLMFGPQGHWMVDGRDNQTGAVVVNLIDPALVEFNRRYHAAAVWDGKTYRLFVDGHKVAEKPLAEVPPGVHRDGLQIGALYDRSSQQLQWVATGQIDEIRISDVARYTDQFTPQLRFESDEHTLAHYHCDEGQGSVLNDASGNGHRGRIYGAEWTADVSAPPRPGFALQLAPKQTMSIGVAESGAASAGPFTFEFTVRPDAARYDGRTILASIAGFLVVQEADKGGWRVTKGGDNGTLMITKAAALPASQANRVALVVRAGQVQWFVDGKLIDTQTQPAESTAQAFQIATFGNAGHSFSGQVDEVRISRTARYSDDYTPAERLDADADTIALYHFDEGEGDFVYDSSGNGHYGYRHSATWVTSPGSLPSAIASAEETAAAADTLPTPTKTIEPSAPVAGGKIAAPDLSTAQPVRVDEMDGKLRDLRVIAGAQRWRRDYVDGKYVIEHYGSSFSAYANPLPMDEGGWECDFEFLTAAPTEWTLALNAPSQAPAFISISNEGTVKVALTKRDETVQWVAKPTAMPVGVARHKLFLVFRDGNLETYLNGVAALDPISLPPGQLPAGVGVQLRTKGKGAVAIDRLRHFAVASVPAAVVPPGVGLRSNRRFPLVPLLKPENVADGKWENIHVEGDRVTFDASDKRAQIWCDFPGLNSGEMTLRTRLRVDPAVPKGFTKFVFLNGRDPDLFLLLTDEPGKLTCWIESSKDRQRLTPAVDWPAKVGDWAEVAFVMRGGQLHVEMDGKKVCETPMEGSERRHVALSVGGWKCEFERPEVILHVPQPMADDSPN